MKVQELMSSDTWTCRPDTTLAAAATAMWDRDCGILPIVGDDGRVEGVLTDRDICMAAAFRGRSLDEIRVAEVGKTDGEVWTCAPQDSVDAALSLMGLHRVRRLPVVEPDGQLAGMLSLSDVARVAQEGADGLDHKLVETLARIDTAPYPLEIELAHVYEVELSSV